MSSIDEPTPYERVMKRLYKIPMMQPENPGLYRITSLLLDCHILDDPYFSFIHIGGSNGKGSVASKIATTLQMMGYNTGLFTSPHISSYRERIQINSVPISENDVCCLLPKILEADHRESIQASFFELTTALALKFFFRERVQFIVLEAGLGGRHDATNVIRNPALCVLTSIGLEHTTILGDTVEKIAEHKAGILKPRSTVLIGPTVPKEIVEKHADQKCCDVIQVSRLAEDCQEGLNGAMHATSGAQDYDVENTRIARVALQLLQGKGAISKVPSNVMLEGPKHRPPCRFEICKWVPNDCSVERSGTQVDEFAVNQNGDSHEGALQPSVTVILDVAHNPPGIQCLLAKLKACYPETKQRFLVGFSADKDISVCIGMLLAYPLTSASRIHLVQARNPRAARVEQILKMFPIFQASNNGGFGISSIAHHLRAALELAHMHNEILVACGSSFIMSDIRNALGYYYPVDSEYITG